jgi:hypothetical protein
MGNYRRIFPLNQGFTVFVMLSRNSKTNNLSPAFAIIKIILVWTPRCHFFAMSHGKCECDGIGGTIKRQASLKNPYEDEIMTSRQIQGWAIVKIPSPLIIVALLKTTVKERRWRKGFKKARTLLVLRKYTALLLSQKTKVPTKVFLEADIFSTIYIVHLQAKQCQV